MIRRSQNSLSTKKLRGATSATDGKAIGAEANRAIRKNSKLATVIALLRRKGGATIEQMMKATGWQSHSVRGAMSGAIKRKYGLKVVSSKNGQTRSYHIAA